MTLKTYYVYNVIIIINVIINLLRNLHITYASTLQSSTMVTRLFFDLVLFIIFYKRIMFNNYHLK